MQSMNAATQVFAVFGAVSWIWLLGRTSLRYLGRICDTPSRKSTLVTLTPILLGMSIMAATSFTPKLGAIACGPSYSSTSSSYGYPFLWLRVHHSTRSIRDASGQTVETESSTRRSVNWAATAMNGAVWSSAGYALLGLYILITILRRHPPGHCAKCGYNLLGLIEPRCPECATPFGAEPVARATGK